MTYYQILRQRRIDLNLSIQDVSSQTRLAPEYIQAIELNNLEVFSDDFSFVRYFVRAYCDAIGVNWQAISAQVDANIRAYAHQRNMALTQAQQKMVNTMPSAQGQRTKRSSKNKLQKRVTKISRNLNWSRQKLMRTLVIFGVGVFVILFVVNLGLDYMAEQRAYQAKLEKENLLEKKEQETERLAKQRQKEAQKEQIVVENTGVNTYT
ncbi:MAG: helix-turn-helix domain-containing protein, partial [Porphyromonadaceae bacterium]|nr:helix-turn-helix domain-containing protein [Porphyromonadaceae bacterium]